MEIRRIQWQDTIALRNAVLWPNESAQFCHVDGDDVAWHFGGFVKNELVCVASVFCDEKSARLRKFATAVAYQGNGFGTQMLEHIFTELSKTNVTQFWCDARESALAIYRRFGMNPEGGRFYKGEVPYFKMSMSI